MAIKVEFANDEFRPRVYCDVCGEPIQGEGRAEWDMTAPQARVYHSHKTRACDLRLAFPEANLTGWIDLDEHLALLVHNTKVNLEDAIQSLLQW